MGLTEEAAYDTAGSVKELAESGRPDTAALASRLAASVYGMQIMQPEMQDHENNQTRFLLLAREAQQQGVEGPLKASVAFSLKNMPGALFKALAVFALRDIDLTKLESRPLPGETWNYMFYLDFVVEDYDERGRRAIDHLQEISTMLRVLGVYPRAGAA
jgi:prephenate dehydratase